MAALRGWARTASTAAKLASVEQIIGYNFKSVERLYEAMDIEKVLVLPNGEERSARRTRNTRLALVGDAAAQFHLAGQWYDRNLDGIQWVEVRTQGLCNDTLGKIGFSLGLDELTVPEPCEGSYAMASTVEAILGAVHYDGGEDALKRVMARCGISHKLLEVPERAWTREAMTTSRNLPQRFFAGHQWELQSMLFRINPKVLPRSDRSRIARLPLDEARLVLEATKARVEAMKIAEEIQQKRKEEKAKRVAELQVEKERQEAAQRVEKLRRRAAAEKARKAASRARRDERAAKAERVGKGQQTSLWGNLKRFWLGSDDMAGSNMAANTVPKSNITTEPKAETVPDSSAKPKPAESKPAESDTAKSDAKQSDTVVKPNTVTGPEDIVAESSTANGSDTVTEPTTGAEPSEDSQDTEESSTTGETLVLNRKQRRMELSNLRSKIKSLNNQRQVHAQQKKRSRRKGQTAIEVFESKLAELDSRLNVAKQSLRDLEKQKPEKQKPLE